MCVVTSPVSAIQFCTDFLEVGNEGSISGLKTFDGEWIVGVGDTVEVDVWISGMPEPLLTAGFWVFYDSSLLKVENVAAFDNIDLPGPWDYLMTRKAANPKGPGHFFACGNLSGTSPDGCNDVLIARLTFGCVVPGDTRIALTTIPGFDSVVGYSGTLYDTAFVMPLHTLFSGSPFTVMLKNVLQQSQSPDIPQLPVCTITVE
jgi:hypothetical protein